MARKTVAQLEAHIAALESALQGEREARADLQSRIRHDYVEREEYNRVQAVLRSTQQFARKYKSEARSATELTRRPFRDRCADYFQAHPEARSVTPTALLAWEQGAQR